MKKMVNVNINDLINQIGKDVENIKKLPPGIELNGVNVYVPSQSDIAELRYIQMLFQTLLNVITAYDSNFNIIKEQLSKTDLDVDFLFKEVAWNHNLPEDNQK